MGLHIDVRDVTSVLLADGWHDVEPGTFTLDAYEFADTTPDEYANATDDRPLLHGGGAAGVCATGFEFAVRDGSEKRRGGSLIAGPLTAVLAVQRSGDGKETPMQKAAKALRGTVVIDGPVERVEFTARQKDYRMWRTGGDWHVSLRDGTGDDRVYERYYGDSSDVIRCVIGCILGDIKTGGGPR